MTSEKQKIVYLDDSEIMLEVVKHVLEERGGYQVYTVNSWPELNHYLFRERVEVLLCDIDMPGLKGDKLAQTLRETIPHLKIILFSALEEQELSQLAVSCGADGWISKNMDQKDWLQRLQIYLHHKNGAC